MPYRSVKSCFRAFNFIFALTFLAAAIAPCAHAVMTINSTYGGQTASAVSGATTFFAVTYTGTPSTSASPTSQASATPDPAGKLTNPTSPPFMDTLDKGATFNYHEISVDQGPFVAANPDGQRNEMLQFNLLSTVVPTVPAGSQAVIIAKIGIANSTSTSQTLVPIPIQSVNGVDCPTGCQAQNWADANDGLYYAAQYTVGQSITIGFYPSSICRSMFNPSGAFPTQPTSLCGSVTNNGVQVNTVVPTAGAPVQWQITFELHVVSDQVSSPAAGDAALDSEVMNWSFQVDRPGAPTCQAQPMNASNPQAYFPADGAILFDPSRIAPVFASPNDAPAFQLMTFAKLGYVDETGGLAGTCPGCAPLVSQGFLVNPTGTTSNYTFVARNQVGTVQTVGAATPPPGSASGSTPRNSGFLNSPPGSGFGSGGANDYQVTFVMADATGLLALPYPNAAAQDACTLANVETAAIQGFLKTGSGCFIATAAFESYESPPVRMLRRFRDQVLLKSSLGERFVQWYYDWSPPAADWLNDHGWFRIPVLTALIPLQVFAWICLNPLVTLLFATLSGAIAMPWVRRRARLRDAV